jgi:hypothetical protein
MFFYTNGGSTDAGDLAMIADAIETGTSLTGHTIQTVMATRQMKTT